MNIRFGLLLAVVLTCNVNAGPADGDLSKLAAANNIFAFKLLKQLAAEQPRQNFFISPYSVATSLEMVANGAAGQTKKEMEQVLETSALPTLSVNEASRNAAALLISKDTNLILTTANAVWYRQGTPLKPGFLSSNQQLSSFFKAMDFSVTRAAEAEINQWASDQTHGRITGIADGMVDPVYTDLILANAIYFKGKWVSPFDKNLTKDHPFHPAVGLAKDLPMMSMKQKFMYRKGSGYQAVRLPYIGDDLAMYVFLPDTGLSTAKLLQIMNGDKWRRITVPGFNLQQGSLVLPKFKLDNMNDLNAPLKLLGMKTAFNDKKADFSKMFRERHHISDVRQKAFVEVSEEGTEAAAVTAIEAISEGIEENPPKPFEMIVDRPFMFIIAHGPSEMILFMGMVNDL